MSTTPVIGVDVAKDSLHTDDGQRHRVVPNQPAALRRWLRTLPADARFICEPSGGYERTLLSCVHQSARRVCLINARHARAFGAMAARALGAVDLLALGEHHRRVGGGHSGMLLANRGGAVLVAFAVLVCLFVLTVAQNWAHYSAALMVAAWVRHKGDLTARL